MADKDPTCLARNDKLWKWIEVKGVEEGVEHRRPEGRKSTGSSALRKDFLRNLHP